MHCDAQGSLTNFWPPDSICRRGGRGRGGTRQVFLVPPHALGALRAVRDAPLTIFYLPVVVFSVVQQLSSYHTFGYLSQKRMGLGVSS